MIGDRDSATSNVSDLQLSQLGQQQICLRFDQGNWGHPIALDTGDYQTDVWYWNYHRRRKPDADWQIRKIYIARLPGNPATEQSLTLEACGMVRLATPQPLDFEQAVQAEQQRFCHDFGLLIDSKNRNQTCGDNFCELAISLLSTESIAGPTVIAGYPGSMTSDTLIGLD